VSIPAVIVTVLVIVAIYLVHIVRAGKPL